MSTTQTDTPTAPQPGDLVRYSGTLTEYHGLWRVRGPVEHGPYAGRICLDTPQLDTDPPGVVPSDVETLIVSDGASSITPVTPTA